MEDKIVHKFIAKFKDKLSKNKTTYPSVDEYAFNSEEIENMSRQNKQKIQELKQDVFSKKKKIDNDKNKNEEIIRIVDTNLNVVSDEAVSTTEDIVIDSELIENVVVDDQVVENEIVVELNTAVKDSDEDEVEDKVVESNDLTSQPKNSFIHLSSEYQEIVMNKWNEIDLNQIDKDIIDGKDLLNHNYTITYADDAARFIHDIRKRYEVVICYLIGFNNEKKGIFDKVIFSDKIDEEWKFLSNYIKILEKIRSFRKNG